MKTKLCIGILLLAATLLRAQTNHLTSLLQQGLFEEQANRNLNAAIADYQTLAAQFDKDRQLAATAIFRLGECYRAQGKTNEAAAQYQRILRDFSDQQTLATLSRQDLAGMAGESGRTAASPPAEPSSSVSLASSELEKELALLKARVEIATHETNRAQLVEFIGDKTLQQAFEVCETVRGRLESAKSGAKSEWSVSELEESLKRCEDNFKTDLDHWLSSQELQRRYLESAISQLPRTPGKAWQPQRDLLTKQIALAEQDLADTQNRAHVGKATQVDVRAAEREVLRLRQQLAALDSGRGDLLNLSVPASSEEDQEIARIQQMIQNSPDLINAPDDHGHTPLEKAALNGWLKVAAFLLDHGADVNARSGLALLDAAQAGNRTMVEFLLAHGANTNAINPLFAAVRNGFAAVTQVLLANKADVNGRDSTGNTPLSIAAQRGQTNIVQMLLAAGAKVNVENNQGRTPLSFAAEGFSIETVKMLLDAKADPNAGGLDAPLLCAIHKQDAVSAELLLQAGANPNAKTKMNWSVTFGGSFYPSGNEVTPLFQAVYDKQLPLVQLLLKFKADPNDSQTDGRSLLFWGLDKPKIVQALLDAGADANARDETEHFNVFRFGQSAIVRPKPTLLQKAAELNQPASVELLLQHGADPNAADIQGNTALHHAAFGLADETVFASLLDHKANPNVRNEDGKTPLDIVKQALQNEGWTGRFDNLAAKNAQAEKLIALLHQHGALDNLPDWDRINVSRPANHFSATVFQHGTNDWNHFTLLELLYRFDSFDAAKQQLSFPDLTRVIIARPESNGAKSKRITVNLLNATNGVDCARDVPLDFGDVVEIPEREHSLAEKAYFLSGDQARTILNYFRNRAGEAKLVVAGGQTVDLPLQPFYSQIGQVLSLNNARATLTSNSDLARVKVIRRDPNGKTNEWTLDCSNQHNQDTPDLWLRAGDVIEVPLKP